MSQTGSQMSPNGLGWIIIDSLDTSQPTVPLLFDMPETDTGRVLVMLMNLTQPLAESRKWLHRSLTWDQDQDINTFETTIRMLGGLLSAHYLAKRLPDVSSRRDHVYLEKAVDLANRLLAAYDSPSGIPYASVNLGKRRGLPSHADAGGGGLVHGGSEHTATGYEVLVPRHWRRAVLEEGGKGDEGA